MRQKSIVAAMIGVFVSGCSGGAKSQRSTDGPTLACPATLDANLDQLWDLNMSTFPGWATYEGIRDYDDRLSDESDEAQERYVASVEAISSCVSGLVDVAGVDRDTQRMVELTAQRLRAGLVCKSKWWDVNGLGGPQVDYLMMPVFFSIRDPADQSNLEKRYRATGPQIDQIIANLTQGVQAGYAPTKTNVERALSQLDQHLASPIAEDPMLKLKDPSGAAVDPNPGVKDAVENVVRPALARYRDALRDIVLVAARPDQGIADLPTAKQCYAARMQSHIGPGYTADELHQAGLDELAKMHEGMVEIGRQIGLDNPSAQTVMKHFAEDPQFYAKTEQELVDKNDAVVRLAAAAMPRAFGRLPKTPVQMRPIEAHRAASAPAAYYYGAPEDGSRPAYYYVNTSDPTTRPLFNLEALAFHEAVPGHHQQIALAKEIPDVHVWRRNAGQTAYVEGWALYAEMLADELELYSGPMARFGMYNYQAWRAARLVIDTGLHHKGWSRAEAIDFLKANTTFPDNEIANEIDRYIAWPGQALAYMVGRMKIRELRARAIQRLGDAYSLRAFNDAVNANGAVPLTLLEANINEWIATMDQQTAELPDFRDLWDFNEPKQTRAKFEELQHNEAVSKNETYRLQLQTQIARTHSLTGEFDAAHAILDELEPALDGAEPIVTVRYLLERGRTFNSAKKVDQARPLFLRAWDVARRASLDGLAVDAAHMMGIIEPSEAAIEWNERAMAYAEASPDPAAKRWLGALYNNMGWTHHDAGDFVQALALFEKGVAWREQQEAVAPLRIAKWSVGRALRSLERTEEALQIQLALEREWAADGKPDGFVFEELGELYLSKGDQQQATQYFARAFPLLQAMGWVEKDRLDRIARLGKVR